MRWKLTSPQEKPLKFRKSQVRHFVDGLKKVKLELLKLRPTDINIIKKTFSIVLVSIYLLLKRKGKKSVIAELVPKNNWMTWKDKSYVLEVNTLSIELLQTSGLVLTGTEKVFKPFWNSHSRENSKKLWLPIETDYQELPLSSSNGFLKKMELISSSLKTKKKEQENKNLQKTFSPSSPSTVVSKWEKEDIRVKKILLHPTPEQKIILRDWFFTSRAIYNNGVDKINEDGKNANFMKLRNELVTSKRNGVKNENVKDWMLKTPKDIRADTLKELVGAFKGNMTKLKKKLINHFDLSHKTKKETSYSIPVPKTAIKILDKQVKIYGRYIRDGIKIKEKKDFDLEHDCKLEWRLPNRFYLIIPYKRKFEEIEKEKDIVALDPGIRKFMTSYSQEEVCQFHIRDKIEKYNKEIDSLKSNKKGRKGILKRYFRINNLIREFHYEVINYLTRNYKTILLPTFDSQEFFGNRRVINRKSARALNNLSHYKFKERLRHRCNLTNTSLFIVDESFTSKTCTGCGIINNVGGSETYKCSSCHLEIDRDVNGARNIFIKNTIWG